MQGKKETPGTALPGGWGGLGGTTIHALSVGNVAKLVSLLETPSLKTRFKVEETGDNEREGREEIVVLGVGGINSGVTLKHFLDVGAVAGEVGTALGVEGVGAFERIYKEAGFDS